MVRIDTHLKELAYLYSSFVFHDAHKHTNFCKEHIPYAVLVVGRPQQMPLLPNLVTGLCFLLCCVYVTPLFGFLFLGPAFDPLS